MTTLSGGTAGLFKQALAPSPGVNVPIGQIVQFDSEVAPSEPLYLPAVQAVHTFAPAGLQYPRGHAVQFDADVAANKSYDEPAEQDVHGITPAAPHQPGGHCVVQAELKLEPDGLIVPY